MYINSGNMIILQKSAQDIQNVKTPDEFDDRELTRAIRDAIIDEEKAIKKYEAIADASSNDKVKTIVQSIADEEKVHVGELQKLLNDMLPDEEGFLEEGAKEVEGEIDSSKEVEGNDNSDEDSDEDEYHLTNK